MQLLLENWGKRSWSYGRPRVWQIAGVALASGLALLLASCGGSSTPASGGGGQPTLQSVSVTPTAASLNVGSTLQFKATAGYSDGSSKDVSASAQWSSTDPTVASIESNNQSTPGLATGVAPGNVNISATLSGVPGITTLNVVGSGSLTAFSISHADPTIATNATLPLFGYAEYSDGSAGWVTSTTHWTSSDGGVATIQDQGQSTPGLVSATNTPGATTITASFNGMQATTTVTVAANAVPINLMDMSASQNYLHFAGGLYENNGKNPPSDHDAAGRAAAAAIQPLDQNGNASADGAIVFLGIGMSNADQEFGSFASAASASGSGVNPKVAVKDGAMGAATACYWTVAQGQTLNSCPDAKGVLLENQYDRVRDQVLAQAGLSEKQVQVLWIKNANPRPGIASQGGPALRTLCDTNTSGCLNDANTDAIHYEAQLGETIRAAKSRYPNLKQVFLSTRIYAGYSTVGLNPEPYAYEYGYSAKWLIEAQVLQERNGTVDPVAGDMSYTSGIAAWTAWGTYLWANGSTPRSDGTVWLQGDFQSDGTHPNAEGTQKVVNLLMTYFLGSPYTPWFRP